MRRGGVDHTRHMASPRMRTLAKALETLGSEQALADTLGVPVESIAGWLKGTAAPPDAVYLVALEIVAKGPFNGMPRGT